MFLVRAIKSIPDLKNIEDSDAGVHETNSLNKRPKHSHITPPQELLRDLPACSSSAIESPQLHLTGVNDGPSRFYLTGID